MFEERANIAGVDYLFSGMEFDSESGMNYFHARYNHPKMTIFITRDPLEDKKLWNSPYAYCFNNPLRYIDPDGRDEWEFTAAGHIENVKSTEFDSFHKVTIGKDGKSTRVEGGELILDKKVVTGQTILEGKSGKSVNYLNVTGDAEAKQIFEHISNNSTEYGTEYGLTRIGDKSGDNGLNMIGVNTTHTNSSTYANSVVFDNGFTIREAMHNHPNNDKRVSGGDIDVAKKIQGKFPNASFFNYTQKYGYTPYDKNTPYPVFKAKTLPVITINP